MRQVAQSHRIACRNPDIDKDVRSKIAKVVALPLHENGTSRYYCFRSGDRTVLLLERPYWVKPLCLTICYRFRGVASWKYYKIYRRQRSRQNILRCRDKALSCLKMEGAQPVSESKR
jgi:hypothetical protein